MSTAEIIFEALLAIFALVMIGLVCTTTLNVYRLRNKRMSWRGGTMRGYPLFPTIFLLIGIILLVAISVYGSGWEKGSAILYVIISGFWFIASYYSSKRFVTDNGIVKNVNDPDPTIAWHQIHDFVEYSGNKQSQFIFFYHRKGDKRMSRIVRLPLKVPAGKLNPFKKLITRKLGHRLHCFEREEIDISELEGL